MKVTITEKGEGFIIAKFEATDHIEHLILETCGMGTAECNVTLGKEFFNQAAQQVHFGGFRLPVHSVLQEKQSMDPLTGAGNAPAIPTPYLKKP